MTKVILGPFTGTCPILKETPMILTCPPTCRANVVPAYNLTPNTALL